MIRHLRHSDVDKDQWDVRLMRCADRLWYAQSWVLDLACPGWEVLVDEDTGAIMPLTCRTKWGIRYLFQPLGLQQLGVFSPAPSAADLAHFLRAIPKPYRYADIQLNTVGVEQQVPGFTFQQRNNQVLALDRPIVELRAAYAQGHRRNLRAADGSMRITAMPVAAFAQLFRTTTGARYGPSSLKGFDAFAHVMQAGVDIGQCDIVALHDARGPVAAACFAEWEGRCILLKSASTERGMTARAMFRIVDDRIARHADTGMVLDFAGSMTPSVARFNAGFGAEDAPYLRAVMNRLPRPLRWLK